MAKIIIEIDGVKHKLVKDTSSDTCINCSINHLCYYPEMDGDSICTALGGELDSRFEQI